jgi:hypothetical protein
MVYFTYGYYISCVRAEGIFFKAQEVSQLRTVLGGYDVAFKKQEKQGAFSHVIDASLVLATAI